MVEIIDHVVYIMLVTMEDENPSILESLQVTFGE